MTSRLYCSVSFVFPARAKTSPWNGGKMLWWFDFCAAVDMKFRAKGHGILTSRAVCLCVCLCFCVSVVVQSQKAEWDETSNQRELVCHVAVVRTAGILFLLLCYVIILLLVFMALLQNWSHWWYTTSILAQRLRSNLTIFCLWLQLSHK